jgi:hypothetical protein
MPKSAQEHRLKNQESVRKWLADYERHWGPSNLDQQVAVLERFCSCVGKTPDEIIEECLRTVEEGKVIRVKARRQYLELIGRFEAGSAGRRGGNVIRSFLLHNGVALSASLHPDSRLQGSRTSGLEPCE